MTDGAIPANVLEVACTACNARSGERCTNLLDAKERQVPHARRIELARNTKES